MARLDALPSQDIIHGMRGTIDYYVWRGIPCARSWPRMGKENQTEATKQAAQTFGEIIQSYHALGALYLDAFKLDAEDQKRTARDIYVSAVHGNLHRKS